MVSEFSRSQEQGKVYIDYGQNSAGKTMICPYSLRATQNASVSIPLSWNELQKGLKPEEFNIFSVVQKKTNPWEDFWEYKQKLDGIW